jgi:D-lactate dehydrogenase
VGVKVGHFLESVGAAGVLDFMSDVAGKVLDTRLPGWNENIGTPIRLPHTSPKNADAIYFPACVTRMMGGGESEKSLNQVEMLLRVAERAGVALWIPEKSTS